MSRNIKTLRQIIDVLRDDYSPWIDDDDITTLEAAHTQLEEKSAEVEEWKHNCCACVFEEDKVEPKTECAYHSLLRAEVERFREALKKIVDEAGCCTGEDASDMLDTARKALEPASND